MIKLEKFSFFNNSGKDHQLMLNLLDEWFGKQYIHKVLKYHAIDF